MGRRLSSRRPIVHLDGADGALRPMAHVAGTAMNRTWRSTPASSRVPPCPRAAFIDPLRPL